jgi:tetratricopeptide (TPR) repeat protein
MNSSGEFHMLRIHLAQILFNAAYFDPPIDFLEEPWSGDETICHLGKLRSYDEIRSLLAQNKTAYLNHIRAKIIDITNWCARKGADILAFPEYSVPFQLLEELRDLAVTHSLIIVAGSHRIPSDEAARRVYLELGLQETDVPLGAAGAPIIFPDGSAKIALKLKRSKWEPNLNTPTEKPTVTKFSRNGNNVSLAVVPCVDSLHPEVLGALWSGDNAPQIIVCPSLSPSVELFHSSGALAMSKDALFAYVNTASFGGTFFQLPSNWAPYLKGLAGTMDSLPSGVEGVLEIEVDPEKFFSKKGSIESAPVSTHPLSFPLVYSDKTDWLRRFNVLKSDLTDWLLNSERDYAIDWIDSFLAEDTAHMPDVVVQNLKYLRHSVIPLFDGNIDLVRDFMEIVQVSLPLDTAAFWATQVNSGLRLLGELLIKPEAHSTETILDCLKDLKAAQQKLPSVLPRQQEPVETILSEASMFIGEDHLVESFQNRGQELDQVRAFLANQDNRVVVITGAIGVGKSDFANLMFRKSFIDWQLIKIQIPKGATVARIIADIAYNLGFNFDVDSLASASHNVFRQKVRAVLRSFYSSTKRALVLDDVYQIVVNGNARDHRHLDTLITEAANPPQFAGGRMFILSSAWLPNRWMFAKGIAHLHLKALSDLYIRRIIEYHLRRSGTTGQESIPEPPQALLDLVGGHPLSARLVVEALSESNFNELTDELIMSKVTDRLAKELLSRIGLSGPQHDLISKLSVFRLPVRYDVLRKIGEGNILESHLQDLMTKCIVNYDGHAFEMHEAVRRFYEKRITNPETRRKHHRLAAVYYGKIYEEAPVKRKVDPSVKGELVHHLSLAGDMSKAKDFRLLLVSEIKPTAREVYREYHDYHRALSLYRLLAELTPDDPEVLAYVGRCYARLNQWADSDRAFAKAIDTARKVGSPYWWIYRDWGHIKSRFQYYDQAKELLFKAQEMNSDDASINASLAFMMWRQGDREAARQLFEIAYQQNSYNLYVLTFYPKLLEELQDFDYAKKLKERLANLDEVNQYREPYEYDIEDYDD